MMFQDLKSFFCRICFPESCKLFCVFEFGFRLPQCQPWAASGAGNIKNQDFGVSGGARGHFWTKYGVGGLRCAQCFKEYMACRDGLGKEKAVFSNIALHPCANREI